MCAEITPALTAPRCRCAGPTCRRKEHSQRADQSGCAESVRMALCFRLLPRRHRPSVLRDRRADVRIRRDRRFDLAETMELGEHRGPRPLAAAAEALRGSRPRASHALCTARVNPSAHRHRLTLGGDNRARDGEQHRRYILGAVASSGHCHNTGHCYIYYIRVNCFN